MHHNSQNIDLSANWYTLSPELYMQTIASVYISLYSSYKRAMTTLMCTINIVCICVYPYKASITNFRVIIIIKCNYDQKTTILDSHNQCKLKIYIVQPEEHLFNTYSLVPL